MYVGLHVPGSAGRKRSHHRRHRHHHRHHQPGIAEEGSAADYGKAISGEVKMDGSHWSTLRLN